MYYKNLYLDNRYSLGDPALSVRIVESWGEALFECKSMVTLVHIPIGYGKIMSTNQEPSLVCVVLRA